MMRESHTPWACIERDCRLSATSLIRLSGLAFIGLLIASTAMFGELLGAFGDPDHVFEEYYARAANRRGDVAGAYLLSLTGIAFLVFTSALQTQLLDGQAATNLRRLAGASGVIFTALLIASAAVLSTVSFSIAFGESFGDERPFNSGYAMMPQLGAVLLVVVAPLLAALHIATFTFAVRRSLPPLVKVVSGLCAFALLFSVLYLPLMALPAWVLLMSLTAPSRRDAAEGDRPADAQSEPL